MEKSRCRIEIGALTRAKCKEDKTMSTANDLSKLPFDKAIVEADKLTTSYTGPSGVGYYDFKDSSTLAIFYDNKVLMNLERNEY